MKNKLTVIVLLSLLCCGNIAAHSESNRLSVQGSYILPSDDSYLSNSLVLGLGYQFWGVFEFTGNAYLEVDSSKDGLFEKLQSPNVFSAGVGINIPMGGFRLKGDYQRFYSPNIENSINQDSKYSDSLKYGIGLYVVEDVELELYQRTFFCTNSYPEDYSIQHYVGLGVKVKL